MSAPAAPAIPSTAAAPYAASWIHALTDAFDRLPGPRLLAYAGFAVVAVLLQHAQYWSTGRAEIGTFDRVNTYWGVAAAIFVWFPGFLERNARSSFERFRGALRVSDAEADRIGYELTIIPGRLSLVFTVVAAVMTVLSFVADPEGTSTAGLPPVMLFVAFVLQTFIAAIFLQVLYRLIRQVRLVREIFDRHVDVDVFRPGPLHAIANLTATPGAVMTLLLASVLLIVPITTDLGAFVVAWGPLLIVPPAIALAAFVTPLTGAHARLEAQKDRLQDATEQRIRGILADIDGDVDARELGRLDDYHKALTTLLVERDVLARLPTWPWSTATLRAFVSTILLPLSLFVVQQILSRLLPTFS